MQLEMSSKSVPSVQYFDRNPLTFLWIELTNRCNLQCIHCYSESTPSSGNTDILTKDDYTRIIQEGALTGCTHLQFIGGEPTLHPHLPEFIQCAIDSGYTFVEVYTNLTHLPSHLLEWFVRHRVNIATSVYSHRPDVHDRITTVRGSHTRTIANMASCIRAGLTVRAAIVTMDANRTDTDMTRHFLTEMGITFVGSDRVRSVGRGQLETIPPTSSGADLCGKCWQGSLCVAPDGAVSPCIMSKQWRVGSVRTDSLNTIARSEPIRQFRRELGGMVVANADGAVASCNPYEQCNPNCSPQCEPNCNPRCSPVCNPQQCNPNMVCNPRLHEG